jgi:predicted tellurium resistance membrane protein TerC
MSALGLPDFIGKPLAVLLIDLLLAGDNALVIALVCRSARWARCSPACCW